MPVSASLENARRKLTTLRRMAARGGPFNLAGVALRVAAILFALEVVYLVGANALLRTSLIQDSVSSAKGFHLDYASAYSLWPGHVRVRDFSLRVEDYNVQFEVALDRGELYIALSELPFKKFRVTRLDAEGTRFRMRHKIIAIGDDAERVAAYPPLRGFADPPYYVGVPSAPIADGDYDLWSVRIQNVTARVSELWVMEHRFRGSGVARGSFVVKPARWVQVEPAELQLDSGYWTLGEHRVAERVRGKLTCDIPDMKVQESEGIDVLGDISATVRLELGGGQLSFLRAYLARMAPIEYAGRGDWLVDMNVQRGVVERGSRVSLRATPLRARHAYAELSGDWMVHFGRDLPSAPDELVMSWSSPRLVATRPGREPSPELRGVAGSLRLQGVDLRQPIGLGELRFGIGDAEAPSLSWFDVDGTKLFGKARASLEVLRDPEGALRGKARLDAPGFRAQHEQLSANADVAARVGFVRPAGADAGFELEPLSLSLGAARVAHAGKRSEPFALTLDGSGMRVAPPKASGVVRVSLSSTEALLPLLLASPIRDVAGTALALERLEARASVAYAGGDFEMRVLEAESGNLRLRGYLRQESDQPLGAFLLSSGPINVGVTLSAGDTEISPFVSDEWLAATWPRLLREGRKAG